MTLSNTSCTAQGGSSTAIAQPKLGPDVVLQEVRELIRFYETHVPPKPYTAGVLADCIYTIERLRASQPASSQARSDWQPIETAPRDGTAVDLWWVNRRLTDCRWSSVEYSTGVPWGWMNAIHGRIIRATHWMPLPAPPALSRKDAP